MSPERFQQIEQLYHAVYEGSAEEREALLAQADPELRREVESLLPDPSGGEFLDQPAVRNLELLEDATATLLNTGAYLGPYRIEGKLGEGGMGEVFRAVDTRLGRAVAIKTTQERFSDRFEREARAIASLNHPHICTLHDVGPNYLVMELVEGETIAERLKRGSFPIEMVRQYGLQIAAALAEAHAKAIVHRDLKPGNIMIAKSGVKVLDFGLAKSGHDETVTGSHMLVGTPAYMAPEQREGKPADNRSDIYSFGCVLYEMSTGARITSQRRRIPSSRLERIVTRCLEENPERRLQSAAEIQRELAGITVTGSRQKVVLVAAAASGILGLLSAGFLYSHRASTPSSKDSIVLADFVNDTSDPVLGGTLRQSLAIELEQSPFMKIMDDEQVRRALRLMVLLPDARITNPVAHEVCLRQGAAATVDGSVAKMGNNYVVTLQAIACQDGSTLGREQIQTADKERVLNAAGSAGKALRGKLEDALKSIQQPNRPLEQVTTPSLSALQNYTTGISEMNQGHFLPAVQLFQRAIATDPSFAMAYYYLGIRFSNAGDIARSRDYFATAFRLIDRVSEFERDQIATMYYYAAGETDKAIDAFQLGIRNSPRDWGLHNNFSTLYIDLGQFEEGLKEGLEATRLQPRVEPPYRRQLDAYLCTDRLKEAKELARKLQAEGPAGPRVHQRLLEMAYVENDPAAIAREIQWFAGKSGEYLCFGLQAASRNVFGQRRESHKLFRRAADAALREGLPADASEFEEADAQADALAGNCQTARRLGRPALALALCGDAAQAEKLAAAASKLFPNGTLWNAVQLPEIRAAIALRDRPRESVELLASASPYESAYLEAVYVRGLAYMQLRKGAEAVAEFRKVVDHKGANWATAWRHPYWAQYHSLAYLGMARGFALAGETDKSQKAFQDFFELWKDADGELPILQQARAEYSKLGR